MKHGSQTARKMLRRTFNESWDCRSEERERVQRWGSLGVVTFLARGERSSANIAAGNENGVLPLQCRILESLQDAQTPRSERFGRERLQDTARFSIQFKLPARPLTKRL